MNKLILGALLFAGSYAQDWASEFTKEDLARNADIASIESFNAWSANFNKEYETHEIASYKYLTWLDNVEKIAEYNSAGYSFKLRLNQFGDMTPEEFKLYVHGQDGRCFKPSEIDINLQTGYEKNKDKEVPVSLPSSVAWQNQGKVTPVKNQGQCGSCWSFSTTGALECNYAIQKGTLTSLSEQQLVDCAGSTYGCYGCNGGSMSGAMKYVQNEGGLCTESAYPYTARDGTCKASSCGTKHDHNSGENSITRDSDSALATAAAAGCVSVAIEADQYAFQHYSSGVLTGTCGTNLDHGVLVTGYGTAGSQEYWWLKNSWGTSWGEKGYAQICRNCGANGSKGECGINMEPLVPTF